MERKTLFLVFTFFSHHGRSYSDNLDGVSSVGDGHLSPVHDVQTGVQDSIVELGQKPSQVSLENGK